MHDRNAIVYELALLAEIAARAGDASAPGRCGERSRPRASARRSAAGSTARSQPERVLAHADAEFEHGRAEGRELSLDDAVALALGDAAT